MWCESGLFKLAVLRDLTGFHRFRLSDLRTQGLSFFSFSFFFFKQSFVITSWFWVSHVYKHLVVISLCPFSGHSSSAPPMCKWIGLLPHPAVGHETFPSFCLFHDITCLTAVIDWNPEAGWAVTLFLVCPCFNFVTHTASLEEKKNTSLDESLKR